MDRFLFNYRMTPHTTIEVSPVELMFCKRLLSKLDLLRSTDGVSSRVAKKQEIQKRNYATAPQSLHLPPDSTTLLVVVKGLLLQSLDRLICYLIGAKFS